MPGKAAVHIGHERRALLVARGDEFNGRIQQGVHDIEVFFPRDAEYVPRAFIFKALNE
jgi:hypothetical protein